MNQPILLIDYLNFLKSIRGLSPNTIKEYGYDLEVFFKYQILRKVYYGDQSSFEKEFKDNDKKKIIDAKFLASLNIADEYFKDKESFRQFYEDNKEAIENYPALKNELETFKNEYGTYKTDLEEKKEELKDLKILLQEKDAEIINLTKAENDADKLREKIKALQKQAMDLTKENEILKGKIDE